MWSLRSSSIPNIGKANLVRICANICAKARTLLLGPTDSHGLFFRSMSCGVAGGRQQQVQRKAGNWAYVAGKEVVEGPVGLPQK